MTQATTDRRLRYIDEEFHLRCMYCQEYWPLTTEFWIPNNGLRRCRGCWAEYKRFKEAGRRADGSIKAVMKFKSAMWYQANREKCLEWNRAWKAANKDKVRAYNAAYRARKRAAKAAADGVSPNVESAA